jgi:flagellar basal-body rod protein FlgB
MGAIPVGSGGAVPDLSLGTLQFCQEHPIRLMGRELTRLGLLKDRGPSSERMRAQWNGAMLDNLFGPHLNHLQRSLSLTTQRHAMLTNNLANVNTPGYKRRDLDFNLILDEKTGRAKFEDMMRQGRNQGDSLSLRQDGNNVDLEREVMNLAETELRFQALTDMTASYFAGLKNVIREGR